MSEHKVANQSTKITVEKTAKVKDPRKVELGKRLAKERKARQRSKVESSKVEKEQREITDYIDFRYFIGGVGLVATLGGLYYSNKKDKREEKEIVNESGVAKLEHREKEIKNTHPLVAKQLSASKVKKCAAQGFMYINE